MKLVRDILVDACCRGESLGQRACDYAEVRHKLEEEVQKAISTRQEGEVKKLICQVDFAAVTETIVLGEDYIMRAEEYERAYSKAYNIDLSEVKKGVEASCKYVVDEEGLMNKTLHDLNHERNVFYKDHTKFDDYNVPFIDSIDIEPARDVEDTFRNGFALSLYSVSDGSRYTPSQMRDNIKMLVEQIDKMRGEVAGISTYDTEKTVQFMQGIKRLAMKKYTLLPWEVTADEISPADLDTGSEKESVWSFLNKDLKDVF